MSRLELERNTFFNQMQERLRETSEKVELHNQKKQQIVETYGWDSDELHNWYEEDRKLKNGFSMGAMKAYWAWKNSVDKRFDDFVMDDFVFDRDVPDFIITLRKAGIDSFVYTNKSTAVMDNIFEFSALGYSFSNLTGVSYKDRWTDDVTLLRGLRFCAD